MTLRSGRIASAADRHLKTLPDVLSATVTDPAGAPISRPIRSPMRWGAMNHPASFQPRISMSRHSSSTTRRIASGTAFGNGPSELPSR